MSFTKEELGAWWTALAPMRREPWFCMLEQRVERAYACNQPPVFPPRQDLFAALRVTEPETVRCVILGQDPYHEPGQAHGLSFSVRPGVKIPRSLQNIFKELHADLDLPIPSHGCLEGWAKQGVLLLNNVLTVYQGQANSHKRWGWEMFTTQLLKSLSEVTHPIAFVLWGRDAQTKGDRAELLRSPYPRLIIRSNHPSPLSASRGFFGSSPFSRVNQFLEEHDVAAIDWNIP